MLKLILKWLIPSADDVTKMISKSVKDAVNNSGKAELISKYAGYSDNWNKCQKYVTDWLLDGKIDDEEQKQFEAAIKPLVEHVLSAIKEKM